MTQFRDTTDRAGVPPAARGGAGGQRLLLASADAVRRAAELPVLPRAAAGFALVLALAALGLRLGASMLHLQLMLLAAVLTVALLLGTAAGVVGATAGFGALLWRGLSPAGAGGGGWSLDLPTVLDAFL